MKLCPHCHMPVDVKMKYYELQETSNWHVYHNSFYTSVELESAPVKEYIKQLKSDEYIGHFVHLKEISEHEYLKSKTQFA